jgi:hypothetical protein
MARLRREEEAKHYERMTGPPIPNEKYGERYSNSQFAHLFPAAYDTKLEDDPDDITYAEVNRQVALIFNVLISIIACAFALWMAARHWRVEARLALSMTGSIIVAVAEVVIYSGYLRRLSEAKQLEKKKVEVKTVEDTWVIEGNKGKTRSKVNNGLRARSVKPLTVK